MQNEENHEWLVDSKGNQRVNKTLFLQRYEGKTFIEVNPRTLRIWNYEKANRDLSIIRERYEGYLDEVREWLKKYPHVKLRVVSNPKAFIDAKTEEEEPNFWKAKKAKKTWDGIYPYKFKLSDIDVNPYLGDRPMTRTEIHLMLLADADRIDNTINLIKMPSGIRLDLYPDKEEEGVWL